MTHLSDMQTLLANAWWLAMGVAILFYVALDGADLGAGIFGLFAADTKEREAIMASMAGTWDANETWLVVAGGVMFATFPFVYGSAFSYLMVPLAFALWGVMSRAVAMEYRHHAAPKWQHFSDIVFGLASLAVTFFGGVAIGAVLQGFKLTKPTATDHVAHYAGGTWDFLTPFSVWVGIAVTVAVVLSGVLYVRARFEKDEPIRQVAARWTNALFYLSIAAILITIIWSAINFQWARDKWFSGYFWFWAILGLVSLFAIHKVRAETNRDRDFAALIWYTIAMVVLALGALLTMHPWLVPNTWTITGGASPTLSLATFTMAMGAFLPVMIVYNCYQFFVFRKRITKLADHH